MKTIRCPNCDLVLDDAERCSHCGWLSPAIISRRNKRAGVFGFLFLLLFPISLWIFRDAARDFVMWLAGTGGQ